MRLPYHQVGPRDFAPIVTLGLSGGKDWLTVEAYVDSGASFSIFHADYAKILGLTYKSGQGAYLTVGDGGLLELFLHRLNVRFADKEFMATVGFSEKLGVGFNLLGRADFFDRFRICFDDRHRFVEIVPLK